MKQALAKFLLLTLPVLLTAAGLECALRHAPTYYTLKRLGFEASQPQLRMLVLGASQTNQGIRPDFLDAHAFNLAHVGQDFYYDLALIRKYAARLPDLKVVILPIAFNSLEYRLIGSPEEWRAFCYGIHYGIPNESFKNNFDLRHYSLLALTEPIKALRQVFFGSTHETDATQADGFQSVAPLNEDVAEFIINDLTGRKRVRYHQSIMHAENRAANVALLEQMADELKARQVSLVLVTLPVSGAYAHAVPEDEWQKTLQDIRSLAHKYGLAYWDYRDQPEFNLMDFSDCDHLNRDGAAKFSRILKNDLEKAGLTQAAPKGRE